MDKIKKTESSVFSWRNKNPFGFELPCKYKTIFPFRKGFCEKFQIFNGIVVYLPNGSCYSILQRIKNVVSLRGDTVEPCFIIAANATVTQKR